MPLFRKKASQTVVGPDGTPYVAVPTEELDEMLRPLGERAIALYGPDALPQYADLAAKLALVQVVLPLEEEPIEPTPDDLNLGLAAASLGYVSRLAEFSFVDESQENENLRAFVAYANSERTFGEDWFANVVGTAASLMNAAAQDPFGTDTAPLLGPVGIGYDLRVRFGASMVANLLADPDSDELRILDAITSRHLFECWRFGYWLCACDASLPEDARRALMDPN